jgi:hypothetical protein
MAGDATSRLRHRVQNLLWGVKTFAGGLADATPRLVRRALLYAPALPDVLFETPTTQCPPAC